MVAWLASSQTQSASEDYNSVFGFMADRLYLSIWFPSFREPETLPRLLSVLRQFPYSAPKSGLSHLARQSVPWHQPSLVHPRSEHPSTWHRLLTVAAQILHGDNRH